MKRRLEEIKRCTTTKINGVSLKQKKALDAIVKKNLALAKYQLAMTQKEAIRLREDAIRLEEEAVRCDRLREHHANAVREEKDKLEQLAEGRNRILEICASIVATRTLFDTYSPDVGGTLHNVLNSSLKMPEDAIALDKPPEPPKELNNLTDITNTDFALTDSFSSSFQVDKMDESYFPQLITQI